MKHLYSGILKKHIITHIIALTKALQSVVPSAKLSSLVVGIMLLFPLLSSAQAPATFTSVADGKWRSAATWGVEVPADGSLTAGVHFPGADNEVIIATGTAVTIENDASSSAKCKSITLSAGDEGVNGSKISIEGVLEVGDFDFVFAQGASANKQPVIIMTEAGHLKVSGAFGFAVKGNGQAFFVYSFAPGSTIEYNGSGNQSIVSFFPYKNLILSGSGKKITDGPLGVAENFTIDGTADFDESSSSYTHTIGGNWTNNATFTPGNSTVLLTGSLASLSQVKIGGSTTTVFNNLTVDLPDDNSKSALLTNDITVANALSFSNGILHTGEGSDLAAYHLLTLAPSASLNTVETDALYIRGRVATQRQVSASGAGFGGIGFNISASTIDPGEVRVERVTGFTRSGNDNESVPRYFEVGYVSGDVTDLNLRMEFSFLNRELQESIDKYELVREIPDGDFDKVASINVSSSTRPLTVQNTWHGLFGRYTLSNKLAPLPVELSWFRAEPQDGEVLLTWQTAWELENRGFEVQLSADGQEFRGVGFVSSGTATRTGAQNYSFLHEGHRGTGTRYYRLAQHDLDGTVHYSTVRSVEVQGEGTFSVYPNPFQNELTVVLPTSEACRVVLSNHLGKAVYNATSAAAMHSIRLNTALKNGVYFLTVYTGGNTYTTKLIKR